VEVLAEVFVEVAFDEELFEAVEVLEPADDPEDGGG
jgi:hypothetical protein